MTNFLDNSILQFILSLNHRVWAVAFWQMVSHLTVAGTVAGLVVLFFQKEKKWLKVALYVCGLLCLIVTIEVILKPNVARLRPFMLYGFTPWTEESSFSFPSGHSANAFYWSTFLALLNPKKLWPLWLIALAVVFSRLYLGVHYFTDTLAGSLLGFSYAYLCFQISRAVR